VPFSKFLEVVVPQVEQWLKNSKLDTSDVPFILSACVENENLRQLLCNHLVQNFINLTVYQAAAVMIHGGAAIDNAELVEICDRIIVSNLESTSKELGGTSFLFQVFKGFLDNKHSRPKVIQLLMAELAKDSNKLSISE
jgi:hypothetical protein